MSDITPLPFGSAWAEAQLVAQRIAETTGLSLAEVAQLPIDEYLRLSGRPTVRQMVQAAYDAATAQDAPPPVTNSEAADFAPSPPDVASMDWATYAAYREQSGIAARSAEGMSRHAGLSWQDRMPARTIYGYRQR